MGIQLYGGWPQAERAPGDGRRRIPGLHLTQHDFFTLETHDGRSAVREDEEAEKWRTSVHRW